MKMARIEKEIYEGKIQRDVFGSWDDCDPGLYIDTDMIETIMNRYRGKNVRLTIEVIPEKDED